MSYKHKHKEKYKLEHRYEKNKIKKLKKHLKLQPDDLAAKRLLDKFEANIAS